MSRTDIHKAIQLLLYPINDYEYKQTLSKLPDLLIFFRRILGEISSYIQDLKLPLGRGLEVPPVLINLQKITNLPIHPTHGMKYIHSLNLQDWREPAQQARFDSCSCKRKWQKIKFQKYINVIWEVTQKFASEIYFKKQ